MGMRKLHECGRPILPQLAERFKVIAPDLPGIGDSAIPAAGLDMKSAANTIHALARKLGVEKARVVGHDIGLMVAYAYAAQFPSETEKLVVMDAFLPGVEGGDAVYNNPNLWHFRFHGPTPEALVKGRERMYFDYYWNDFAADKNHSLPEADRAAYAAAYARPGRMKAGWAYFSSFPANNQGFCATVANKIDYAGAVHWRRKVARRSAGAADEIGSNGCDGHSVKERRPLDPRRATQGNNGCPGKVFIKIAP